VPVGSGDLRLLGGRRASVLALCVIALAAWPLGCSQEVAGPAPTLGGTPGANGEEATATPAFACNEQLETWIELQGSEFSPLVVDVLDDKGAHVVFPTVTLVRSGSPEGNEDGVEAEATLAATDDETSQIKWVDPSTIRFRITPELALPAGVYDLRVTNANGNTTLREGAFGILPRPVVEAIRDDLLCVDQGERAATVFGDHFLSKGDARASVTIDAATYDSDSAGDCRALHPAFGGYELCKELGVTVPAGDQPSGRHLVSVNNLEPAGCKSLPETDDVGLIVVPPPVATAVAPEPICAEQLDYATMRVSGADFLKVTTDGTEVLPTITVGATTYDASAVEGCTTLEGPVHETVEVCDTVVFAIPAGDQPAGLPDVAVHNPAPAGCSTTEDVKLAVLPPPTLVNILPEPICTEQFDNVMAVTGQDFYTIDGQRPTVTVGANTYAPSDITGCEAVDLGADGPAIVVERCDTMTITVPQGDLTTPGNVDVSVTNPEPAGCTSTDAIQLTIVPPPTVALLEPQPICTVEGDNVMTLTGTGLLSVDGTLPTVAIGDNTYVPSAADGCAAVDGPANDVQACTSLTLTVPQGDFAEPGDFAVVVTNPTPAACASTEDVQLTVVPSPTVTDILPEPICAEQLGYDAMVVSGTGFLKLLGDAMDTLPTVTVGDLTYEPTAAGDCVAIAGHLAASVEVCQSLTFQIAAGDLPAGNALVRVTNPDPAACSSTEAVELTVVPPPTIAAIGPSPICTAQAANDLTITGTGFLSIGGALPTVTLGDVTYAAASLDGCEDVAGPATATQACTSVTVTVPQGDLAGAGQYSVRVTNPETAACSTTELFEQIVVPPPTVAAVDSDYFCSESGEHAVSVTGTGFLQIGAALPSVNINGQSITASAVAGCAAVTGTADTMACTGLTASLPAGLTAATYSLTVTNPAPAACVSEAGVDVQALPAPQVSAVAPPLFCASTGQSGVVVTGVDFFVVNGERPVILVGDQEVMATSAGGCTAVTGLGDTVERCTDLTFDVPAGAAVVNTYDVVVRNPAPVDCTNLDATGVQFVLAGGPSVQTYTPPVICRGQFDGDVTLGGTGFFDVDGTLPTVDVNGTNVAVAAIGTCAPVSGVPAIRSCESLDINVPVMLRDQDLTVTVTNPAPADCDPSSLTIDFAEPPVIDDVQPLKVCSRGGALTLTGDHFEPGMAVDLDGVPADTVDILSINQAVANWNGGLTAGLVTLTATNTSSCATAFDTEIRVTDGPVVFFVDPPVVYNGISIRSTIYLGNLFGGSVARVVLTAPDDTTQDLAFNFDPARPNRLQATIPAGLTAGLYDVTLIDEVDCDGTTADLVNITDQVVVSVDAINPPFGDTTQPTGVTITTADPIPAGEVAFQPTPRVYINPANPQPGDLANELRATALPNENELNGIVDAGLMPGSYDIIIVNPDGTVGLLEDGFSVPQESPPTLVGVSPGSWESNIGALPITVTGANFRSPAITMECQVGGVATTPPAVTVDSFTATTITASADTSTGVANNAVCILTVTNDDLTFVSFGPILIINPSGNFVDFTRTTRTLAQPTRSPILSTGTPSSAARFLYAMGGDGGTADAAFDTVQSARIDRFGQPGDFIDRDEGLPEPRTLTRAVRIEDFIYIAGGHNGMGAVDTVWRANVLDPLDVPRINALDFNFVDGAMTDVGTGVYYYRVAAVLAADNAWNPGGETLPSDPQPVFVPDISQPVHIQIEWTPMTDAVAYRVYRSPMPDLTFGQEELLAEIPADTTRFVDDGAGTFDAAVTPRPVGTLGTWHNVATLAAARYSHGVAVATDLSDSTVRHLYVGGGENGMAVLASIEAISIQVGGPRDQTVQQTMDLGDLISPARSELEIVVADPSNASRLETMTERFAYLYVLSGRQQSGQIASDVDLAAVAAGGTLGMFSATPSLTPPRAGYVSAVANNTLLAASGQQGGPDGSGNKGEIADSTGALDRWSSLSNINLRPRYLAGRAVLGGFFYVAGGVSDAGTMPPTLSDTLDVSILGGVP